MCLHRGYVVISIHIAYCYSCTKVLCFLYLIFVGWAPQAGTIVYNSECNSRFSVFHVCIKVMYMSMCTQRSLNEVLSLVWQPLNSMIEFVWILPVSLTAYKDAMSFSMILFEVIVVKIYLCLSEILLNILSIHSDCFQRQRESYWTRRQFLQWLIDRYWI